MAETVFHAYVDAEDRFRKRIDQLRQRPLLHTIAHVHGHAAHMLVAARRMFG